MRLFFILLVCASGCVSFVKAQNKQVIPSDSLKLSLQKDQNDLQRFYYFHPENQSHIVPDTDTVLQHDFTRFNPTDKRGQEHITLGNTFSAAYPLLFQPEINIRFAPGYNQYKPYAIEYQNAKFYTSDSILSEVYFSQFANQLNFSAGAKVSIPFRSGWKFSLDYFRVSEKGFYLSHAIKTTNLSSSIQYISRRQRYSFVAGIHQHAQDEENNGGIRNESDLIAGTPTPAIPTFIRDAKTRHQKRGFSIVQNLKLAGNDQWKVFIRNTLLYQPSYYKYSDATTIDDTLYYGDLLVDSRGLRRYLDVQHGRADFALHGENKTGIRGQAGIMFDQFVITDQRFKSQRTDVTLHGSGVIPIFKIFELKTKAAFGLGENAGNFIAEGSLDIFLKKWALLKGGIRFFVSEPSYSDQKLVINDIVLIDSDFEKMFGSRIFGNLNIIPTRTKLHFAQSIITNSIYWQRIPDSKGQIQIENKQWQDVLSYTLLGITQDLKIYNFDFNHAIYFQLFSQNLYNLPPWYSTHQLYWNIAIFKTAMSLSVGAEARILPEMKGVGYSPLHGRFFSDDTSLFPLVPDLDLVLNVKVKTFRASIMIENAGKWFINSPNFDVANYPLLNPLLRFSLRWQFKN